MSKKKSDRVKSLEAQVEDLKGKIDAKEILIVRNRTEVSSVEYGFLFKLTENSIYICLENCFRN